MKILKPIIFLTTVFFLAVAVWFSPILFKGYVPHDIGSPGLILGRNLAETDEYAMESDLNVFLASSLIKEQAHPSAQGNKLTPLIYGQIFKITGPLSEEKLILFCLLTGRRPILWPDTSLPCFSSLYFLCFIFGVKKKDTIIFI
jgi:hypothetical protein